MAKVRLDDILVARGLAESKTKAQALIAAGNVYSAEIKLDKPGHPYDDAIALKIREAKHPWVSRGGMKLAHALEHFGIDPIEKICLDIGASTGGFTDVLLRHGAAKVYAVDVGHGQLDWKLRQNECVIVLEKTNARYLDKTIIPDLIDLIVCDASFISLKKILPAPLALAKNAAYLVALIKPQFEVGKGSVGKGGVVRDAALHQEVCDDIVRWLGGLNPWRVLGITESPITGPKGNIEFLIAAQWES